MDLSVLIPARNEEHTADTVRTILGAREARTEVIVVADGAPLLAPLPKDPFVHLVDLPVSIGQRQSVNLAARMARGKYVMKLDAHCMVGPGFDRLLIEPYEHGELEANVTTIPRLYNLHAFNWLCPACGHEAYQGPKLEQCSSCHATVDLTKKLVWEPRWNRITDHMRFDNTMHFQYWKEFRSSPMSHGDFPELLSSLGATFFMRRDRFWELGGMDEGHGSWGQFGTEISCKSWLSGGRQVTSRRTWYSHLFRTQKGFSFPYRLSERQAEHARQHSRKLWLENTWSGQTRPLSWLLRRFWPVPTFDNPGPAPKGGAVYYTDAQLEPRLADACRQQLQKAINGHELVSVSLEPLNFGVSITFNGLRDRLTMFQQILEGLRYSTADYVFLCEHDVLYHPSHFDFIPPRNDRFYFNTNVWKVDAKTGRAVTYDTMQVSGCCASRTLLLDHYTRLVEAVRRDGYNHDWGYEPGAHVGRKAFTDVPALPWRSPQPNVDIRHGGNLTKTRWSQAEFRDKRTCQGWREASEVPGWGSFVGRFA